MSGTSGDRVEAVIFDWGGTLTPWHAIDLAQAWAALTDDPVLIAALRAAEESVWIRSRDEHRSASINEVLRAVGHDPGPAGLSGYHDWWDQHTRADPEAAPMLSELRRRGIRIGVLSNTLWSRDRHEAIFARDHLLDLIDGAVYTSEISWTKPHPEAFRAALDAVGSPPAERSVFVGDRLFDDIYGAASVGMRTIFIPHSTIPPEQIGHALGRPDAVVARLSEIPAVIDAWS